MTLSLQTPAAAAHPVRAGLRLVVVLSTLPAVLLISGEVGAP